MGDESFAPLNSGFLVKADGEWENLGYIGEVGITITDSDDVEVWADKLLELSQTVSIAVKAWWSLNRFYKLATGRYKYTVPRLRRWNKGHGRSRNAGRNRHPRH